MPRLPRLRLPDVTIHLVQRGVDRAACFFSDDDRTAFLAHLAALAPESGCAIHAYVLMDNHVHLLLTPRTADGASRLMQRLGRRYVRRINVRYGRTGTLWEGRYRSCLCEDDARVLACYRYIELNPVRAGMVTEPGAHPWSSWHANAAGAPSALLTPHPRYLALGPDEAARSAAYRRLVDETLAADAISAIREATNGNYVYGGERFRRQVAELLGRRASRGRPGPKGS